MPRRLRRLLLEQERQADLANERTNQSPQNKYDGKQDGSLGSGGFRDRELNATSQSSSAHSSWEIVPGSHSPRLWNEQEILRYLNNDAPYAALSAQTLPPHTLVVRPQPPLPHDPADCNLEWVLRWTQDLFNPENGALDFPGPTGGTEGLVLPSAVNVFWSNLSNCIYFQKILDYRRFRSLYVQLCTASAELLGEPTPSVLLKLFKTFSPLNFPHDPVLRDTLLKVILRLAQEKWGKGHPATEILKQLRLDKQSRWVTENALSCLQSTVQGQKRWQKHTGPGIEFDIATAIIALLRRDRDFNAAAYKAEKLLALSEVKYLPESLEVRVAAQELAHIYMDVWQLDDARRMCMKRLGPYERSGDELVYKLQDSHTLWALEDLGEIERKDSQAQIGVPWLISAAELGINLGKSPATVLHMVDKVMDVLKSCGKEDEGRDWQRKVTRLMNT